MNIYAAEIQRLTHESKELLDALNDEADVRVLRPRRHVDSHMSEHSRVKRAVVSGAAR